MNPPAPGILARPALNGWRLYLGVTVPMSAILTAVLTTVDLATPAGVSTMIRWSVRLCVPFLLLAFAASSLAQLVPGRFSQWLLRNRRMIGLCFATGMAWQAVFILWLVIAHTDYFMGNVYGAVFLALEGIPSYLLLIAMTLTSFRFGRRRLSPDQWKLLHKVGIYYLWAYVLSTYWYELYYYDDIQLIDYAYYAAAVGAWLLRVAAWSRRRALRPVSPG